MNKTREYLVTYDIDGTVLDENMNPAPGKNLTLTVSANNKQTARKSFFETYFCVWNRTENPRNIRIERK